MPCGVFKTSNMVIILLFFCPKHPKQNEALPQPTTVENKKVWMIHVSLDTLWRHVEVSEGIRAAEIVPKNSIDWSCSYFSIDICSYISIDMDLSIFLTKNDTWQLALTEQSQTLLWTIDTSSFTNPISSRLFFYVALSYFCTKKLNNAWAHLLANNATSWHHLAINAILKILFPSEKGSHSKNNLMKCFMDCTNSWTS